MDRRTTSESQDQDNADQGNSRDDSGMSLQSADHILNMSHSKSTMSNMSRSEKLLLEYAKRYGAGDPVTVSCESTQLLLNMLMGKCRYNTAHAMQEDTLGGYIQGLRLVYSKYNHRGSWTPDVKTGTATGNPLTQNPDVEQFRRSYRVNLALYGDLRLCARPLTPEIVCDHAEYFWFGTGTDNVNTMDVVFHSIAVLGLSLGLRFDEFTKLKMEHVSIGRQSASLTLIIATKNSAVERIYEISDWDGNTPLHFSVYMDPFIALHSWVIVRGNQNGYLFPDVVETQAGQELIYSKPLSYTKFVSFMRERLSSIGVGTGDAAAYNGHSLRRGCVQLHRSLGYMDEYIMRKVGMVGPNAYANYCAGYINDSPKELPRFHSWQQMVAHAKAISGQANWVVDRDAYTEFEVEVWGEVENLQ